MAYTKPHFGNLQKRAKALGFEVTRMSTDEDARAVGHHEYVLTAAESSQRTKDNSRLYSLSGIRAMIEKKEAAKSEIVTDACGNEVKPSDPDYKEARDEMRGKTVPVFRNNPIDTKSGANEAIKALDAARTIGAMQVFSAMDKTYFRGSAERIKADYKNHICSLIGFEIRSLVDFSEVEKVSTYDFLPVRTDTHITGRVVVVPEAAFLEALSILKKLSH